MEPDAEPFTETDLLRSSASSPPPVPASRTPPVPARRIVQPSSVSDHRNTDQGNGEWRTELVTGQGASGTNLQSVTSRRDTDQGDVENVGQKTNLPSRPSVEWKLKVFLLQIEKMITIDDLEDLKSLIQGEDGSGRRAMEKIKTAKQFFQHLTDNGYLDCYNLLYLQSFFWHLERKDIHKKLVTFARDYRTGPLHFFLPDDNPRNGYIYADFHVGGDLQTTNKQELEELRALVAELLCIPPKFVFVKGLQPLHSLVITFMVPEQALYVLFELSELDKAMLQNKKIDSFKVGDKRVDLKGMTFEKPPMLSEEDEIKRIMENKKQLSSKLDESQVRLIERSKELSSSEEELAKIKDISDQLKLANDRAMMILATLVYQDLANNKSQTDSLCRLSVLAYFKYCFKQFQCQFPEAASHVGDLLDANSLVVRKTERDSLKNYVERLQIHQLTLEHKCQIVPRTLSDQLFQTRLSASVQEQHRSMYTPAAGKPATQPPELKLDSQGHVNIRKKLFDRRMKKEEHGEPPSTPKHPCNDELKEISRKLKDNQKVKLRGNISFNKVEEDEITKHPEMFLHRLLEKEHREIPSDPYEPILKKLHIMEDHDVYEMIRRYSDKAKTMSASKRKKDPFSKSIYVKNPVLDIRVKDQPDDHALDHVHKSASEPALSSYDMDNATQEKLDDLLIQVGELKRFLQAGGHLPPAVQHVHAMTSPLSGSILYYQPSLT